jgi:hypothetical protein
MITEKEANLAREKHSDYLQKSGAHTIAVDKVKTGKGKNSFGVIAYYENEPDKKLPKILEIENDGKKIKVPLQAEFSSMAKLE